MSMHYFDTTKFINEIANKFTYIIYSQISALKELIMNNFFTENDVCLVISS